MHRPLYLYCFYLDGGLFILNRYITKNSIGRFFIKTLLLILIIFLIPFNAYNYVLQYEDVKDPEKSSNLTDDKFLELIEKRAFLFFWHEANPENGLVKDRGLNFVRSKKLTDANSSSAATGFALTAICIGIERGWVDRDTGYKRILITLRYYLKNQKHYNGMFIHFVNMKTGKRDGSSEVSTIDTALFLAGAILAGEYFKGTEVEKLADKLYKQADWAYYLNNTGFVSMGLIPEKGIIEYYWGAYCEGLILNIMAIGSPTYPVSADVWYKMNKQIRTYRGMTSIACGPCFTHHYSQLYIDFRNMNDGLANYHINTILAMICNRDYCIEKGSTYKTFNKFSWGLTACDGYDGTYKVFGAEPEMNKPEPDGTAAPTCVGASVAFAPTMAIPSLRYMYDNYKNFIWGHFGFTDSYNMDKNWRSDWIIGIDQAAIMLAIENYRSGMVWKYFMKNKYIQEGLKRIGFKISKGIPISLEGKWDIKTMEKEIPYKEIIKDKNNWKKVWVPDSLQYQGYENYKGYVWYITEFNVSDKDLDQFGGEELGISLGAIDDVDKTYLNGKKIGQTGKFPPNMETAWDKTRVYKVKKKDFKINKKNTLAVLVYSDILHCGIYRGPIWIATYEQLQYQSLKHGNKQFFQTEALNLMNDNWKFKSSDSKKYADPEYDDSKWKNIYVPKSWTLSGFKRKKGYGWYRYHINFESSSCKKGIKKLYIKSIGDVDEIYFNGQLIGSSGKFPPKFRSAIKNERYYTIPQELIKYDQYNVIAIRVYSKNKKRKIGLWKGPIVIKTFKLK